MNSNRPSDKRPNVRKLQAAAERRDRAWRLREEARRRKAKQGDERP